MKRIILSISGLLLLAIVACKKSWLTAESPSSVDTEFVFSSTGEAFGSLVGCYDLWRTSVGGMFYDIDAVGSDAESHPEAYDAQLRHIPEGLYALRDLYRLRQFIRHMGQYVQSCQPRQYDHGSHC